MRLSLIATLSASAALCACSVHRSDDTDAGPTVSRNYQVGNFEKIEVAGPYDVQVRTGANPSVSANGSQKLIDVEDERKLRHFFEYVAPRFLNSGVLS